MADLFARVGGRGRSSFGVAGGGGSQPSFDTSEYRQNTYGVPTHYCDPTRSLASSGTGTFGNPWNITQAWANATAGMRIGVMESGDAAVVLPSEDDTQIPTLNPGDHGTSSNPVIFVTRYAAVALNNVDTNSLRTQLKHDGIAADADLADDGPATGGAIFGAYFRDYIVYDGFFVDTNEAHPRSDSGVFKAFYSTGSHFRNLAIKCGNEDMHSNAVIWRPNAAINCSVSNGKFWGFHNAGTQRGHWSDDYGALNIIHEYLSIWDWDKGPFWKGTAGLIGGGTGFNYGVMRYIHMWDCLAGLRFHALDHTEMSYVHHNLIEDWKEYGLCFGHETENCRNMRLYNNSCVNALTGGSILGAVHFNGDRGEDSMGTVEVYDNVFDMAVASGHGVSAGTITNPLPNFHHNGYYRTTGVPTGAYNGDEENMMSAWQTLSGTDANSRVFSSNPFPNRASRIYTLPDGHEGKTGSSTGGVMGYEEGGVTPGAYGSYGF